MNRSSAFASPLTFEEKEENVLGEGGYGVVYRGTFEGNAVAVKVTVKVHLDDKRKKEQKREMDEHLQLDHENVLKLLHVDDSRDKTYFLLELCAGTLTDYCEKKYNGPELPPDGLVLYQIANGLQYIHSQNLVHRDVKPDNILISMTTPVQMKLSDFGFVKTTNLQGSFTQSGLKGTPNWMAPEILVLLNDSRFSTPSKEIPRGTIQSDTFAAGCVFFYFLTRGTHPFGSKSFEIPVNILNNNPIELNQHVKNLQGDDRALYELIGKMIKKIDERIALPKVIIQLTTNLIASRQFKRVERLVRWGDRKFVSRFHPTKLVLACGLQDYMIFFSAENSSIPFSNWKENEKKFKFGYADVATMEWNADGTQLAAIAHQDITVWSYPSGEILFQKKVDGWMNRIEWNSYRPYVFATFGIDIGSSKVVFFFNSCPVDKRPFNFCTIERGDIDIIENVQWISGNRVALGLRHKGIEIWEIDESTNSAQIVKRFKHDDGFMYKIAWDERTKCLAACSSNGWMTVWSMDSDQPIHALKMVNDICWSLAWRPNGKQTDDDEGVEAARRSADNFILACGLDKGRIVIVTPLKEVKTRILISQHQRGQHSSYVKSLSFSADGRFLASADDYKKLTIWSTENWKPVYSGEGERWGEKRGGDRLTWICSSSTDVPDYKLTCSSRSSKVVVVEHVDGN